MKLILASSSIHRKKILAYLSVPFEVIVPDIDEEAIKAPSPHELVKKIALEKAKKVHATVQDTSAIILSADSLAVNNKGDVLGKPKNKDDAERILRSIIGTWHSLLTGYTLIRTRPYQEIVCVAETKVLMRPVGKRELDEYIQKESWQGLAGGYGIQQEASSFIEKIEGCFLNVVGLPLKEICDHLVTFGIEIDMKRVQTVCSTVNTIHCCIETS